MSAIGKRISQNSKKLSKTLTTFLVGRKIPFATGDSVSPLSVVNSKTNVSKNLSASNFVPTEPGYKNKLKQLSAKYHVQISKSRDSPH